MKNFTKAIGLVSVLLLTACGASDQVSNVTDKANQVKDVAGQAQNALGSLGPGLVGLQGDVSETLNAAKAGDFGQAQASFGNVQASWNGMKDEVSTIASAETVENIQGNLTAVADNLKSGSPDKDQLVADLGSLGTSLSSLGTGGGSTAEQTFQNNLLAMQESIGAAVTAAEANDMTQAKASFGEARQTWFKFGGSVKQQSADTYGQLDDSVKSVNTQLSQSAPDDAAVLSELQAIATNLETVAQ